MQQEFFNFIKHAPVEHGVERRYFVHSHGLHFEQLRHVVHNTDARPSLVLSLADIEEGNDGRLLVLWWIMRDDFIGALKVLRCELERNLGEGMRQPENQDKVYENTPGLLFGLSLCCNVDNGMRDRTLMNGVGDKPRRERRSAEIKKWICGVLEELDEFVRKVLRA